MLIRTLKFRNSLSFRTLIAIIVLSFSTTLTLPPQPLAAQTILSLPSPGSMVPLSLGFSPVLIRGIKVDFDNPFHFQFLVDRGDTGYGNEKLEDESLKIIRYFLASLTVPEKDLWVNLSPYDKDRIIPEKFGLTEMGRDMLVQDYLLKQLTATLIYPEKELGKNFWDRVYQKAYDLYGTTNIAVNTFNKVWIVPDEAVVYENNGTAFVGENRLKVLTETDYLALKENTGSSNELNKAAVEASDFTSTIVRELIIPEIEKEVNEGKNFSQLRQIYHSLILAVWYKKRLKESILSQAYVDKEKVAGIDVKDKDIKQKIYNQYIEAFKVGVYDYIKEDYDKFTQDFIPRKYFSGGTSLAGVETNIQILPISASAAANLEGRVGGRGSVADVNLVDPVSGRQLKSEEGPAARLEGRAILRIVPFEFRTTIGGIERHLTGLNEGLARRSGMTTIQMYFTEDQTRDIEEVQVGRGRIIYWPVKWIRDEAGKKDLDAMSGRIDQEIAKIKEKYKPVFGMLHEPLPAVAVKIAESVKRAGLKLAVQYHRAELLDSWQDAKDNLSTVMNLADFRGGINNASLAAIGKPGTVNLGLGINLDKFKRSRPQVKKPAGEIINILFPNQIREEKAADVLLRAVADLVKRGVTNIHVRLQGQPVAKELEKVQRLIDELGIREYVEILPAVGVDELVSIYENFADIVVLPSRAEGLGRVLVEANAMELPVVGARVGGIPEGMVENETGLLFENEDFNGLASQLQRLIENPDLRYEMGQKGKIFAQSKFSQDALLDRHEAFYANIIQSVEGRDPYYALSDETKSLATKIALGLSEAHKAYGTPSTLGTLQEGREYIFAVSNPSVMGGAETYLFTQLFYLLKRNNITVHLVFVNNNDNPSELAQLEGQVMRGQIRYYPARDINDMKKIMGNLVEQKSIDKIVALAPSEVETKKALEVARERNVESLVFYHGADDPVRLRKVLDDPKNLTVPNLERATTVAVVSQAGMQAMQRKGIKNARLAGPMARVDAFGPSEERTKAAAELRKQHGLENEIVILAPSRMAKDKGPRELLRALKRLRDKGINNVSVVMIGGAIKEIKDSIDAYIRDNGLSEKVKIFEQMSQEDLAKWHMASDIVTLPSYTEGFGLTVLEAELSERMVVATQSGGIPEAMVDGRTGIIVNFDLDRRKDNEEEVVERNSAALAAGLERAINMSPEDRKNMGKEGRKFALENFDPEKLIERHEQLIRKHPIPDREYIVNIVGLVASGKSSVASEVAKKINGVAIDVGSFYRLFALLAIDEAAKRSDPSLLENEAFLEEIVRTAITAKAGGIFEANGKEITPAQLGSNEVAHQLLNIRKYKKVQRMIDKQAEGVIEKTAYSQPVVLTNRGLYANALVNIFVDVPFEVRAGRDHQRALSLGETLTLAQAKERVAKRDKGEDPRPDHPGVFVEVANEDGKLNEAADRIVSEIRKRAARTVDLKEDSVDEVIQQGVARTIERRLKGRAKMSGAEQRFELAAKVKLTKSGNYYVQLNIPRKPVITLPGNVIQDRAPGAMQFTDDPLSKSYIVDTFLDGEKTAIWGQVSPDGKDHVIIIPNVGEGRSQAHQGRDIYKALLMQRSSKNPRLIVLGNSLGGLASVNNEHMQANYYHKDQIPIDGKKRYLRTELGGVRIYSVGDNDDVIQDYSVRGVFLEGSDLKKISEVAGSYLRVMQKYNVLHRFTVTKEGVYLLPFSIRAFDHWQEALFESPFGDVKVFDEASFNKDYSDEEAFAIGRQQSQTREEFEDLYKKWQREELSGLGDGAAEENDVGGIDFNPAGVNLKIKGNEQLRVPVETPSLEILDIPGLVPVIINITPVINLPAFFGISSLDQPSEEPVATSMNGKNLELSYAVKKD